MKLTKEDYMRLPKERLAELLVEMQNESKVEVVPVPSPSIPNTSPCNPNSPFGPIITYAEQHPDPSIIGYADDRNNPYHSETQVNK